MMKQRRLAAQQLAEQLFAAEVAIDAAVAATAMLAATMPAARQTAGLGAAVGQDALMKALQTLTELGQARASIVATHDALAVVQKQAGLGAVNFGGWVDKLAPGGSGTGPTGERSLAAVAKIDRAA